MNGLPVLWTEPDPFGPDMLEQTGMGAIWDQVGEATVQTSFWGNIGGAFKSMATNLTTSLVKELPKIATSVISTYATAKLTEKLIGKAETPEEKDAVVRAAVQAGVPPAQAQAIAAGGTVVAPQPGAATYVVQTKPALPGWVLPVVVGGGVLIVGGVMFTALKK